jgi:hypothetical protein
MDWVRTRGNYENERQKAEVLDLFEAARAAYGQLI